jgi:HAD superfamily hydrolase (TIGR01549 family)
MALAVDGIAFDVGNTLVLDPFDAVLKMKAVEIRRVFSSFGYPCTSDEIAEAWRKSNSAVNYRFVSHFYQERPIISQCMEFLGVEKRHRQQVGTRLLVTYRSGLKPSVLHTNAGRKLVETLAELKRRGKRLIVFGNGRQEAAEHFIEWLGLKPFFSQVTMSEKLGIEKPDITAYKYILRALGTKREKSMYVGDDHANDIAGTKAAGMLAVLYIPPVRVSTPWREYEAKGGRRPDAVIQRFEELLEIVK